MNKYGNFYAQVVPQSYQNDITNSQPKKLEFGYFYEVLF